MKKKYYIAALMTCGIYTVSALEMGAGYRQDTLEWSEELKNSEHTNAEEKWKVDLLQVSAKKEYLLLQYLYGRLEGNYAWIKTGEKKFGQMLFSTDPFPRKGWTKAHSEGHAYDLSCAVGARCPVFSGGFITPLAGYSYSVQNFKDGHFRSAENTVIPADVACASRYQWSGPWLGTRIFYQGMGLIIFGEYQYHWGSYHSKIDEYFQRGSEKDDKSHAHSQGQEISLGICYNMLSCFSIGVVGNYKCWRGQGGDSGVDCRQHIDWKSASASVVAGVQF